MDYKDYPLFKLLNATQVDNFVSACGEITFRPNTTFIEQGDPGDRMYLVLSGELRVFLDKPGGGEQDLVTMQAPAVIGEIEMLTGDPRAASVKSLSEVRALEVRYDVLRRRIEDGDPATLKVFFQIGRVLACRLAAMNKKIAELGQKSSKVRLDDLHAFQQKLVNEWTF
jgi:CRP-like cAMP-binding protein